MSYKILASSDLHLGKTSTGVIASGGISTGDTWRAMVKVAIERGADAVILAGDIVDRDDRYYEAIGQLQAGFSHLKDAGTEVFLVAGNHDHDVTADIMSEGRFPNVTLLGRGGKWEVVTRQKEHFSVQFLGWSFPDLYYRQDPAAGLRDFSFNAEIPTIGILHGEAGNRESKYGPLHADSLAAVPVKAWILGHIHKPWMIRPENPLILYPGSPHALSPKEEGPHGPVWMEITEPGTVTITPLPLSPVRYGMARIDVSDTRTEEEMRARLSDAVMENTTNLQSQLSHTRYMVWDIVLTGFHEHIREALAWASGIAGTDAGELDGTRIQVRKVASLLRPKVSDLQTLAKQPSPAGRLAEAILALEKGADTPFTRELTGQWMKMARETSGAGVYTAIQSDAPFRIIGNEQEARDHLLETCNTLLSELLSQQKT